MKRRGGRPPLASDEMSGSAWNSLSATSSRRFSPVACNRSRKLSVLMPRQGRTPMRTALLLFSFFLLSDFTQAQNAGSQAAQAAQQAAQQGMQANQQAIADMQHASDQAALANQQAMANLNNASQNSTPVVAMTMPPKISVKSGAYTKPITVKLSNRSRGVIMYYTTDGWTPTTASTRYT